MERGGYSVKQLKFLKEKDITIPALGEPFKVGKNCPGEKECYGTCYGTHGVVSCGDISTPPCKNPLLRVIDVLTVEGPPFADNVGTPIGGSALFTRNMKKGLSDI